MGGRGRTTGDVHSPLLLFLKAGLYSLVPCIARNWFSVFLLEVCANYTTPTFKLYFNYYRLRSMNPDQHFPSFTEAMELIPQYVPDMIILLICFEIVCHQSFVVWSQSQKPVMVPVPTTILGYGGGGLPKGSLSVIVSRIQVCFSSHFNVSFSIASSAAHMAELMQPQQLSPIPPPQSLSIFDICTSALRSLP